MLISLLATRVTQTLVRQLKGQARFVFPVHLNPNVRKVVLPRLNKDGRSPDNLHIVEPVPCCFLLIASA